MTEATSFITAYEVSEEAIKGLHILLAEDNELNMEIAEFMLQNEGVVVTKAWNGQRVCKDDSDHCNDGKCDFRSIDYTKRKTADIMSER